MTNPSVNVFSDENWPKLCVAYVETYLSVTGESKEKFLTTIADLAEQSVPDRFVQVHQFMAD